MAKVLVAREGAVRTVTLNRADKRNALDKEMLDGLLAAFSEPPAAEERLAVLRSTGSVFCAGLDLKERRAGLEGESPIHAMLHAVETYPLPVVAVVQGDAIAGGNELALHCDLVVASEAARFGMSLAQIGLAPTWFLAKKLMETAGPVAAREILFLGDPLPAARMHALGTISRCVPAAELEAEAGRLIDRLAANAPLSLRAMKAMMLRQMRFRDGIVHEDVERLVERARRSADAVEGLTARLEKRPARFTGA